MHRWPALFLLIVSFYNITAQHTAWLDGVDMRASVSSDGVLFANGLEIPKGSGHNSIFRSQIWIGGKLGNAIRTAAGLYNQGGKTDFWSGPLDTVNGTQTDTNTWNKIYKVSQQEIDYHLTHYNKAGYQMPDGIRHWPGSNTTAIAFAQVQAPFIDLNQNRVYEPDSGEIPYIKGDEAIYFITNDNAAAHTETGSTAMGIEIHGMAYVVKNNPDLQHTLFLELAIINRSANTYDSVFTGIWTDFSIGSKGDEYLATNVPRSAYVGFNGDSADNVYGLYPPAQAVVFLNPKLQYSIEIADDNSPRGIPLTSEEFYNFLKRSWRDGIQLTNGADGYFGSTPADYIFDGNPCNNSGWTELGVPGNLPGNRTMLGSVGPYTLTGKGILKLDVAFVWTRAGGPTGSMCDIDTTIQKVRNYYNDVLTGLPKQPQTGSFSIYPNPASKEINISLQNMESTGARLFITSMDGKTVGNYTLDDSDNFSIDISSFTRGVYVVGIENRNGVYRQKLVIH